MYCLACGNIFSPGKRGSPKKFCSRKCKELYKKGKHYIHFKMDSCSRCGFIPEDLCQLDVDHIDGNHDNNSLDNLQTLCANCHRLKTKRAKEGFYKFHQP